MGPGFWHFFGVVSLLLVPGVVTLKLIDRRREICDRKILLNSKASSAAL
jgi:hypothetical protein